MYNCGCHWPRVPSLFIFVWTLTYKKKKKKSLKKNPTTKKNVLMLGRGMPSGPAWSGLSRGVIVTSGSWSWDPRGTVLVSSAGVCGLGTAMGSHRPLTMLLLLCRKTRLSRWDWAGGAHFFCAISVRSPKRENNLVYRGYTETSPASARLQNWRR